MKIFVISLKDAVAKRAHMKKTLDAIGCDYEFLDAVQGSDVDPDRFRSSPYWMDPYYHTRITEGEIGCALSHKMAWQKIAESKVDQAVILEDDVEVIDKDFINKCESIEIKYDLVFLGRKKMVSGDEWFVSRRNDLVKPLFSYWACAYLLSLDGAENLLYDTQLFDHNIIPADEYIPYMCGMKHFDEDVSLRIERSYGAGSQRVVSYAFEPALFKPIGDAFSKSSTHHSLPYSYPECHKQNVYCLSIATDNNDCCKRYVASCDKYGVETHVMGIGKKWRGGDMSKGPGGGHKVNLLREFVSTVDDDELFVFTDNYDVIANDHVSILISKYQEFYDGKVVFAGETGCWPDASLISEYPNVDDDTATRYLNSGLFMGYAGDIKAIISTPLRNDEDDQLYYTRKMLGGHEKIVIDYRCKLFLCINGITHDICIDKSKSCVTYKGERPVFVHGNGPESEKLFLNNEITNYCLGYNSTYGYPCKPNTQTKRILYVIHETVLLNVSDFVNKIRSQDYPKHLIDVLVIYNTDECRDEFNALQLSHGYNSFVVVKENEDLWHSIISWIEGVECELLFYQETRANICNSHCLTNLVSQDKKAIAPLLSEKSTCYSNFWGSVSSDGFYKRSSNYFDIMYREEIGCWNVPYIAHAFLLSRELVNKRLFENNGQPYNDLDMIMCSNIRANFGFMYVSNMEVWGSLDTDVKLDTICKDRVAWEEKYLNKDTFSNNWNHEDLGNNVDKLFMFNKRFCQDLVESAEKKSSWSQGGDRHYDERIGNYENHPTQDIQLCDLGMEDAWKEIVRLYIAPFVARKYEYHTKDINLAFIVKYSMEGQKALNPHHDSSTYTVNICLNDDFEGGGCEFIKSGQTVINKDVGSVVIHPGRLTHYHRGLPITEGTRYILVSFIN